MENAVADPTLDDAFVGHAVNVLAFASEAIRNGYTKRIGIGPL